MDISKLLQMPVLASEHGHHVDTLIHYLHYLMGALFVGWILFYAFCLFRFRAKKQVKADYHGVRNHYSTWLEVAVAVVEAFLLVGIAIPMWAKVVDRDALPKESESTVIRVVAQQFGWNWFHPGNDGIFGAQALKYVTEDNKFGVNPDDPASKDDITGTFNEIIVPVDKPVLMYLSSLDVIHSLSIHPFRVCQDAIPGLSATVHFTPNRLGTYMITCAQLCGNAHYSMKGFVRVVSQEDYDAWLSEKSAAAAAANANPASFE